MKNNHILIMLLFLVIGFSYSVYAQNMKDLMKKAKKLSYEGQVKYAEQLMGDDAESNSGSAKSSGWDSTSLLLGMIWGAIGGGYFIYGKKQSHAMFLLCGIGLCIFPFFVTNNTANFIVGLVMTIAPFKIKF